MKNRVPIGERESEELEFKGRDTLRDPNAIGRAVVAMLNANGGEIWIGLQERDGRAVAIEPIERLEEVRRTIRDRLLDTIEPPLLPGEIQLDPIGEPDPLLLIRIIPTDSRKPYAQRKNGGLFFYQRFEDRVRLLSLQEVLSRSRASTEAADGSAIATEEAELRKRRENIQKAQPPSFWVCVWPVARSQLDLRAKQSEITRCLRDASQTGNRESGWNFVDPDSRASPVKGAVRIGSPTGRQTTVWDDGRIEFMVPLGALYWKGDDRSIWPYPLLEFPISVFRLASKIYEGLGPPSRPEVFGDMGLIGIRGWTLRPGSVRSSRFAFEDPHEYTEEPDLVWERPLQLRWSEIMDEPDRCGYRLVARVYSAFGFTEDEIPREFDRQSGRLVFPG